MSHHGQKGTGSVMGGDMKLGKALTTGVAEERPQVQVQEPEDLELPEEIEELKAPEEVPAAR
ncbi:hypothetical protein ACIBL8_22925 [Streptomyces sp. NPDC050523]|uniref:hypothetical protein n=1 Tax=Streptomyces sp. NPDC050523 TaxID=3365622 RepID=UPI003799CC5F